MKFNINRFLTWTPKALSLLLILTWLLLMGLYGLGPYLMAGILIFLILILTFLIAWKNEPIGGGIFILLGTGYLIFSLGVGLEISYILFSVPFYLIGAFYFGDYFYQEHQEEKIEGEDDF